jgi:N-acetylmuramoyl-L-alanine amidase
MRKVKQRSHYFILLGLSWFMLNVASAAQNKIDSVRIWPSPANTRVVLDMQNAPEYSYFTLANPQRLVIDLAKTSQDVDFSKFENNSEVIKKIRKSKAKDSQSTRVVIDLQRQTTIQVFALPPTAPYGNRLVIDLVDSETEAQVTVLNRQGVNDERDILIVLDAGHGGEDPGSIGSKGSYEKDITLSIAKKLAVLINNEPGLNAMMTRSGDYYISPNKRPEIARKHKADLFVSIHADAFTTPQPSGASVWVLSMRRANSELGRWMEQTERHSELLGGAAEVIKDTANERYLTQALLDMSMDHSLATSYDLGKQVVSQLKKVTRLHKRTPQAASLAVLTSPDIPSILVETGFISNPDEEKNLNWDKFRSQLASSIFNALVTHFKAAPPDGTLWAMQRQETRTHKVQSGESLSLLAQRYNVQVSTLKKANNIHGDMVKIGQVLTIPST